MPATILANSEVRTGDPTSHALPAHSEGCAPATHSRLNQRSGAHPRGSLTKAVIFRKSSASMITSRPLLPGGCAGFRV